MGILLRRRTDEGSSSLRPRPVTDRNVRPGVFICGCGHSGTSLLANMFAAHSQVYIPLNETEVFLLPEHLARERYEELVAAARDAGKPWLVEKTPRHIRRLSEIREIVPGARFILPVRDGRDVAASIARRTGNLKTGVKRWIQDNQLVLSARDSEDVWVYRHEDLVDDPRAVVEAACNFIGLPFEEGMLRYHESKRLWFGQPAVERADASEHAKHRNWQINQPVFDSRGRWKNELSPKQVAPLMRGRGRRVMEAFGYLPEDA
jgi:hypothetical protein